LRVALKAIVVGRAPASPPRPVPGADKES